MLRAPSALPRFISGSLAFLILLSAADLSRAPAEARFRRPEASTLPPEPPLFNWDTVPLFMHAANASGPLNDSAARWMARYPLVTIEKVQASAAQPAHKQQEKKIVAALEKVKSLNSSTRTLFYLNTIINFPQYDLSDKFLAQPELLLHDASGKLAMVKLGGGEHTIFDLSLLPARRLWLSTIDEVMSSSKSVDGVFADRGRATAEFDLRSVNLTAAKRSIWNEGHVMLIQQLMMLVQQHRPQTGIVIPNGANIDGVNGRMFENFQVNDSRSVPPNNDILALQAEAQEGRIAEVHRDNCAAGSGAQAPLAFNESLAAYLVGAVSHSYYGCTEGWTLQTGWMEWRPEYSKPLGQPIGEAEKVNGTWTRRFSKGTRVWLNETDTDWLHPCIQWADGTWTGLEEDCKKHVLKEAL